VFPSLGLGKERNPLAKVYVVDGDIDRAIRQLRNKVNRDGIIRDYKASQRFVPKSQARRKHDVRKTGR
jgi:ribosomal protein S21